MTTGSLALAWQTMDGVTRTDLMAAVEARLEGVTKANGYRTNLGEWLRTWSADAPNWDELPVLRVSDPSAEVAQALYGGLQHTVTIPVELLLPGGANPSDLRDCAADLLSAVGADPLWSGLATGSAVTAVALAPGERDRVSAGVTVSLTVTYETAPWSL